MSLINKKTILDNIASSALKEQLSIHVFSKIDSTNSFLKELNPSSKIEICLAEQQTKGRGRLNRVWHSPSAENIYFSCRYRLPNNIANLSVLSLVTGLTIIDVLKEYCPTLQIKWPNDIYWQNQKLAGILIESIHTKNKFINVIIGIGLNINSDLQDQLNINWVSLYDINRIRYDRNIIISSLISKLDISLNKLITYGFEIFQKKWQEYDYLFAKEIVVENIAQEITGTCLGIDHTGKLILQKQDGIKVYINQGEASIKKMP